MVTKAVAKRRRYFGAAPRRRSKAGFTVPLAVAAGFIPLALFTIDGYKNGGITKAGHRFQLGLTGYNDETHKWSMTGLKDGAFPIIAGIAAHKIIGQWLGVNRMLARAKVPIVRV